MSNEEVYREDDPRLGLMFRDDESVSEVVSRHLHTRIPDLMGAKRSITFRLDLYDWARLKWLTETLGVHRSVLIRDLLAAAMADAIKEVITDDERRERLYEQFRREAQAWAEDGEED